MTAESLAKTDVNAMRAVLAELQVAEPCADLIGDRVYLRGLVPCYKTKHDAFERASVLAPGVAIVNELRVAQPRCDDEEMLQAVMRAIGVAVPGVSRSVEATMRQGVIVLAGVVRTLAERRVLEAAIWEVAAGHPVESHLTLEGERVGPDDAEVEAALNAYVRRAMNLGPGAVAVQYRSGVVLLDGEVSSIARARAIEDLLRWHDRVIDVVNNLRVSGTAGRRVLRDVS